MVLLAIVKIIAIIIIEFLLLLINFILIPFYKLDVHFSILKTATKLSICLKIHKLP